MAKISILVINRDPNLRETLAGVLQSAGYETTVVGDFQEALQLLRNIRYDLTLLDMETSNGANMRVVAKMRRKYPNMPLLILTAYITLDTAIEALHYGARDYLVKPVSPALILSSIKNILTQAEQESTARGVASETV